MTTYILAGGGDRRYPEYIVQLARVIQAEVAQPKILSCWFSNPDDVAEESFPKYKEYFLSHFASGTTFLRADRDNFREQVREADVIYFHGGHTSLLLPAMEKFGDLHEDFVGKIVVGSSAGANYLSSVGYSPRARSGETGSGLTDLVTVVHYGSKGFGELTFTPAFWQEAVKSVCQESGKDNVVVLPEGTFVVVKA